MKKKLIIWIVSVFCIIAIGMAIYLFVAGTLNSKTDLVYGDEIKVLNESYPSDIIVMGDEVGFDSTLKYRTISEINESNLTSESKYLYTFFVINDRSGSLNITDEQFTLCKKLCDEKNISFYYIGTHYLEKLKEFGFYDRLSDDNLCGYGYVISPLGHTGIQGIWTSTEEEASKESPMLLGQILAYSFVDNVIKMMN